VVPKPKHALAREHLDRALRHIDDDDEQDAVSSLFYAAEAGLVAVADAQGIDTKKQHGAKAKAAAQLHADGVLDEDFSSLLRDLNQQRKDVWYEGEPVDFADRSIEEVAAEVERLVVAAEETAGDTAA